MIKVSYGRNTLRSFLDEVDEKAAAAVWPATSAAGKVFHDQVRLNVRANFMSSVKGHWFYGKLQKYWIEPDGLYNSIYYAYSKDNSDGKHKEYHIGWNREKAPYGRMLEFGTKYAPARPFLNPAWSRREDAATAFKTKFYEVVNDS